MESQGLMDLIKSKGFTNQSEVSASQRPRGQRRMAGLIDECVSVDGSILNEVIISTTNAEEMEHNAKLQQRWEE